MASLSFSLPLSLSLSLSLSQVYFKRDGELIEVISYTLPGDEGGGGSAAVRGARPLISRDMDDTKLQKSLSLLGPDGRPGRLFTESPARGSFTAGQQGQQPSPATEAIPETVVNREFPRWVQSTDPLYFFSNTHIPQSDGSVLVQAKLTWTLNPQVDNDALFSCEVKHPALSMPMQTEVILGEYTHTHTTDTHTQPEHICFRADSVFPLVSASANHCICPKGAGRGNRLGAWGVSQGYGLLRAVV